MDNIREDQEDRGASLRDRATHERSQSSLSPPSVGIPSAGDSFTIAYPFVRDTYSSFDGDTPTWRPGVNYVQVSEDHAAPVADDLGQAIFTVVDAFKPGRFPTRVFYTRQFVVPGGRRFGKSRLHIATLDKFRRLTRGYQHPFGLGAPLPSDHQWWRKSDTQREFEKLLADYASAIDARSDATAQTGAAEGESAVAKPDAKTPSGDSL